MKLHERHSVCVYSGVSQKETLVHNQCVSVCQYFVDNSGVSVSCVLNHVNLSMKLKSQLIHWSEHVGCISSVKHY